jgi:hypothetical protein
MGWSKYGEDIREDKEENMEKRRRSLGKKLDSELAISVTRPVPEYRHLKQGASKHTRTDPDSQYKDAIKKLGRCNCTANPQ